ncbi:MAG: hypothetical protein U7123_26295 [Potamolinea sp.]
MTILFNKIKPSSFTITIDLVAKFLGIPASEIVRVENWPYVLFVHRRDCGGQFISYRKLSMWFEAICASQQRFAIADLIEICSTFDELWQMGLWIRQESKKFDYAKRALEYLRCLWTHQRDSLRSLPEQGNQAIA